MVMPRPELHDTRVPAVARWTVMWLGWLWLGQHGSLAGWGWAAGTAVVALWWAVQLLPPAWLARWTAPWPARALGLVSALAVAGEGLLQGDAARACVWLAAVSWGLWCGRLRAQRPCGQAGLAWVWAPAWAALLAGLAVMAWPAASSFLAAGLLAACALCLPGAQPAAVPRDAASPAGQWSGMAMGLMMGSLWLSADWCSAAGLPVQAVIAAHLAVMGLLPALLSVTPAMRRRLGTHPAEDLRLLLLAAGGLVALVEPSPAGWAAAMACHALAWAAGVPTPPARDRSTRFPWALAGPVLLLAIGLASQGWGPQALAAGHALLGLAGFTACVLRWACVSIPEHHTS